MRIKIALIVHYVSGSSLNCPIIAKPSGMSFCGHILTCACKKNYVVTCLIVNMLVNLRPVLHTISLNITFREQSHFWILDSVSISTTYLYFKNGLVSKWFFTFISIEDKSHFLMSQQDNHRCKYHEWWLNSIYVLQVRVLELCVLAHCHTLMVYLETWI